MRIHFLRPALVPASVFALLAICAVLATSSAQAAPIVVDNFSFESPVVPTGQGYIGSPSLGGWNYVNAGGSFDYVQVFDPSLPAVSGVTEGNQYYGMYQTASTTRVFQDTGVAWAPNTVYSLSIAFGNRNPSENIGATSIYGLSTDNTAGNILGTAGMIDTNTIAQEDWETFAYTYTTGAVAPLGNIFIVATKEGNAAAARVQIDNVQLDASAVPLPPAPEPASLVLILGGLVFAVRSRKHRV